MLFKITVWLLDHACDMKMIGKSVGEYVTNQRAVEDYDKKLTVLLQRSDEWAWS